MYAFRPSRPFRFVRRLLLVGMAASMAACGGGGGGGGGSSGSSLDLSLSPRSVSIEFLEGDAEPLHATATVSVDSDFSQVPVVVVTDRGATAVLESVQVSSTDVSTYDVNFLLRNDLPAGRYQSSFQVRICSSASCNKVFASETVSYVVQVNSTTHLTALAPLAGAGDWTAVDGDAGQASYVPVTLDPANFSLRWRLDIPDFDPNSGNTWNPPLESVLSADGAVFFRTSQASTVPASLLAVNEADGSVRWTHRATMELNRPVIAGDVVYTVMFPNYLHAIRGLDIATGSVVADIPNTRGQSAALTAVDGRLVYPGSVDIYNNTGLISLDLATQQIDWVNRFQAPVVASGNTVYTFTPESVATAPLGGGLFALDASTGDTTLAIADTGMEAVSPIATSLRTVIVPGAVGEVLGEDPDHVAMFDTVAGVRRWSIPSVGIIGAGEGLTYVMRGAQIDALSNANGTTQWSWAPPETPWTFIDAVFTRNIAFISTLQKVYAVDMATRAVVWTYPRAGALSISKNGVLYIMRGVKNDFDRSEGVLVAVNLH